MSQILPHKITVIVESVVVDGDNVTEAEPAQAVILGRANWDKFAATGFDELMGHVEEATRKAAETP